MKLGIALSAMVGGCIVVGCATWRYKANTDAVAQTNAVGSILLLFLEDQERMPSSLKELVSLGYLQPSQGSFAVGQAAVGREPRWGPSLRVMRLTRLGHDINIGFGPNEDPLTAMNSSAKPYAALMSANIRACLNGQLELPHGAARPIGKVSSSPAGPASACS
jgi:hypothetical protein